MKNFLLLVILFTINLYATQPYSKEIVVDKISNPTLVKLKLDSDIYLYCNKNFEDIRVYSQDEEIGYFIEKVNKRIENRQTLKASNYDRENTTLTYIFNKPFKVEDIKLNIENLNFETKVSVYIDDKLEIVDKSIYDYSNETGNKNFSLKIEPKIVKKISIKYDLKNTKYFTKTKSKYLIIPSTSFFNYSMEKIDYDKTKLSILNKSIKNEISSYIFDAKNIDFSYLEIEALEKNYLREGIIYVSADNKNWRRVKHFNISKSNITQKKQDKINLNRRTRYIKIDIIDNNNNSLTIPTINILTQANYLYFLASKAKSYEIYFGDKTLSKASYDLKKLVGNTTSSVNISMGELKKHKIKEIVKKESFLEKYKDIIFIFIILLAVIVLLYIAFILIKKIEPNK